MAHFFFPQESSPSRRLHLLPSRRPPHPPLRLLFPPRSLPRPCLCFVSDQAPQKMNHRGLPGRWGTLPLPAPLLEVPLKPLDHILKGLA